MSSVQSTDAKVIAILLADIHLSLKPPVWRSAELDWFEAMKRPLMEVRALKYKYDCPVICAGDIFEKWDSKPELINFALEYLPDDMYTIPGQHDLPQHSYEDLHRSAYCTLEKAGKISPITPGGYLYKIVDVIVTGFPFGFEIEPLRDVDRVRNKMYIAVVHDYVWIPGYSYPNAPAENSLERFPDRKWRGYDVVVFGDNHKGFVTRRGEVTVFNCGTLMRRKSDEIGYRPQVGLLFASGEVVPHYLDISKDKYLDVCDSEAETDELDMRAFVEELGKLGDTALDFVEAMKRFLRKKKPSMKVKEIILDAMGL